MEPLRAQFFRCPERIFAPVSNQGISMVSPELARTLHFSYGPAIVAFPEIKDTASCLTFLTGRTNHKILCDGIAFHFRTLMPWSKYGFSAT